MAMGDKSERWRGPILLGLIALFVAYLFLQNRDTSGPDRWKVLLDLRAWKLNRDEARELYVTPAGIEVYLTRSYHLGPIYAYRSRVATPVPFGAQPIQVGMFLYDAKARAELGEVVAVEPEHHFPDGQVSEGLLLRPSRGQAVWTARDKLEHALVGP